MNHSEVIDCVTHIKVLGIGAEGCSLASHVLPRAPHVSVLCLPNQALASAWRADKNDEELAQILADTHLLLIAADITDAANHLNVERVVCAAREKGILVLGVAVPCAPEATERMLQTWSSNVDALLVGEPGQLSHLGTAAYEVADIVDEHGHVNVDFEDVRTILSMQGVVRVGTSIAAGPDRAQRAALNAVQDMNLAQAKGVMMLLSCAKGRLQLSESRQAMRITNAHLPESAHVIFGAAYDDSLGDQLRVTVLVSGLPYASSALE